MWKCFTLFAVGVLVSLVIWSVVVPLFNALGRGVSASETLSRVLPWSAPPPSCPSAWSAAETEGAKDQFRQMYLSPNADSSTNECTKQQLENLTANLVNLMQRNFTNAKYKEMFAMLKDPAKTKVEIDIDFTPDIALFSMLLFLAMNSEPCMATEN